MSRSEKKTEDINLFELPNFIWRERVTISLTIFSFIALAVLASQAIPVAEKKETRIEFEIFKKYRYANKFVLDDFLIKLNNREIFEAWSVSTKNSVPKSVNLEFLKLKAGALSRGPNDILVFLMPARKNSPPHLLFESQDPEVIASIHDYSNYVSVLISEEMLWFAQKTLEELEKYPNETDDRIVAAEYISWMNYYIRKIENGQKVITLGNPIYAHDGLSGDWFNPKTIALYVLLAFWSCYFVLCVKLASRP